MKQRLHIGVNSIVSLGLMTSAAAAQAFTDLATTNDGSVLYFASRLRQKSTDQAPDTGKIFRATGSTVDLAAQPECTVTPELPTRECALQAPDVPDDQSFLAYTFREYDLSGSINTTRGIFARPFFERTVDGYRLHISRNGKWALAYPEIQFATPQLIDLSKDGSTTLTGYSVIGDARQAIADDGTVVLHDGPQNTVLWKAGTVTKLSLAHQSGNARIDRNARTLVYEWIDSRYHLNSYDIATGVDTALWSEGTVPPTFRIAVASALYYQPSLSADSRYVLIQAAYTSRTQTKDLWIVATDGTTARQLTSGEGVTSDVLSGDGITAYAATADNRILRVNTVTVDRFEVVPRTPVLALGTIALAIAPGDYVAPGGSGLENATVLVNNEPAYVIAAHNGNVAFRVPWDAPVNQPATISVTTNSPFESNSPVTQVVAAVPHPWVSQPIHQDFSDFVKPENPARPGEVVHLYLTGLGVIDPLLPLDQPAPIGTPVRAVTPLTCNLNTTVLFAGVAPGQTWIYQADVLIPANAAPVSNVNLICGGATFPISIGTP